MKGDGSEPAEPAEFRFQRQVFKWWYSMVQEYAAIQRILHREIQRVSDVSDSGLEVWAVARDVAVIGWSTVRRATSWSLG